MRFALTGRLRGVASAEWRQGRAYVTTTLVSDGLTAWALTAAGIARVPLSAGAGSAECPGMPIAVVFTDSEGTAAAGGFAGNLALLESTLLKIRLLETPAHTLTAGAAPREKAPDAASVNIEAAESTAPPPRVTQTAAKPDQAQTTAKPDQAQTAAKPDQAQTTAKPDEPRTAFPPPFELPGGAAGSEALFSILSKARELFYPPAPSPAPEPATGPAAEAPPPPFDPFPGAFPGAVWKRVAYPGTNRYYIEGRQRDGWIINAIPGQYAPVSPWRGYTRFMRSPDGSGYWVRIRRKI